MQWDHHFNSVALSKQQRRTKMSEETQGVYAAPQINEQRAIGMQSSSLPKAQ
jgi:hypothetical protein